MSLLWTEPARDLPRPVPRTVRVHVVAAQEADDVRDSERPDRDAAFTDFVSTRAPELLRVAWFLCGDAHRAEELVQETLVRTYSSWGRASSGDVFAYARRVLVNLRTDTWRRRHRETLVAPAELPDVVRPDGSEATHDRDLLVRALGRLTERQRRVVLLRHLLGLTEAEVAVELGVSVGTVKSTASRGLAALRAALEPSALTPDDGTAR
ncbi:SigE family RNA polymerase sigma factor [Luteimicrobium subarcticum]|uniref:RNA polymerase sigma-70 factor (Sigma-E family) n=1 Tax=Luteimicrobium subarcticum TaxID=620910 RepID=A0A2M8WR19_9MICO|nr:SigE family RNA polymerase sigma factor [Luteimicrobium subarcticum]PJI93377.1 RNA polymerase sigma-70 factor (sigma-E family) [Luteimicrobium subarcticum]